MLKISESSIPAAIDMGLLEEVQRDNQRRVSGASIRAFQSKFRPIKELAVELNTSSMRLTRLGVEAGMGILRLESNTRTSKLSLIQRTDGNRLINLFKEEQRSRDLRVSALAARTSEEPRANRLRAYLDELEATRGKLPRRVGKPVKRLVERSCKFPRGTIDRYADLSNMLEAHDRQERKDQKDLSLNPKERLTKYLAAIKGKSSTSGRRKGRPERKGKPRLDLIAQACGIGTYSFYVWPELKSLVDQFA